MTDTNGQEIVPMKYKLTMRTNRHPSTRGNLWGWITGCTANICWSNDSKIFNEERARHWVDEYNERRAREIEEEDK